MGRLALAPPPRSTARHGEPHEPCREAGAAVTAPAEREARYRLAVLGSDDAIWDWDLRAGWCYLCPRWKHMVGLPAVDALGHASTWLERVHPDDQQALRLALDAHLSGRTPHLRSEHRLRHEDGSYRWVLCRGRAVPGIAGFATRIAGTFTDITERITAREAMRYVALHDGLTGLPNRRLFMSLLAEAVERHRAHPERQFAVLFIDVDRFKSVNDAFGHAAGDELLVAVGRRLRASLRAVDTPARHGGDEFVALLSGLEGAGQAADVASRIQLAFGPPCLVAGRELAVSVSIGGTLGHGNAAAPDLLLRAADAAMYEAKAAGDRRPVFRPVPEPPAVGCVDRSPGSPP